jgi:hypothetical protein
MRSPEAYFDTLFVIRGLQSFSGGVTRLHVQRLAFLACLLAVYRNRPMADWGYIFSSTQYGTPYAAALWDAWDELCGAGYLSTVNIPDEPSTANDGISSLEAGESASVERARLTPIGDTFFVGLCGLQTLTERSRYLTAACDSSLAVATSTLHSGLSNEPTSKSGRFHSDGALLLSGPAATLLYRQLAAITNVLQPAANDLFTPSVTWLRYSADEPVPKIAEAPR